MSAKPHRFTDIENPLTWNEQADGLRRRTGLARSKNTQTAGRAVSIALCGNAAGYFTRNGKSVVLAPIGEQTKPLHTTL